MDIRRVGVGLALLLILANVWKWWPSVDAQLRGQDTPGGRLFGVEDFQVHGFTMETPSKSERDLFHIGNSRSGANESAAGMGERKITAVRSGQSHKWLAAQESAADAGLTRIGQIRCIGVLFRENDKPEAYVVHGDHRYILRPGDVLEGQFEVEKITIEAVYFKDRQTGVTGSVQVDGKEGIINE